MSVDTLVPDYIRVSEINELGGELVVRGLTKEQFVQITERFPDHRMEREKNGDITIMAPVKGGTGYREGNLFGKVYSWNEKNNPGTLFSPNTGFDLPDGATKSPDVAWVSKEKMELLSPEQLEDEFIPIVPDFVAEIRSKSDRLAKVQEKMTGTWMANGVRLAWLIDPYQEKAHIYRLDGTHETVSGFDKKLSGEDVMPGFELDLAQFRLLTKK